MERHNYEAINNDENNENDIDSVRDTCCKILIDKIYYVSVLIEFGVLLFCSLYIGLNVSISNVVINSIIWIVPIIMIIISVYPMRKIITELSMHRAINLIIIIIHIIGIIVMYFVIITTRNNNEYSELRKNGIIHIMMYYYSMLTLIFINGIFKPILEWKFMNNSEPFLIKFIKYCVYENVNGNMYDISTSTFLLILCGSSIFALNVTMELYYVSFLQQVIMIYTALIMLIVAFVLIYIILRSYHFLANEHFEGADMMNVTNMNNLVYKVLILVVLWGIYAFGAFLKYIFTLNHIDLDYKNQCIMRNTFYMIQGGSFIVSGIIWCGYRLMNYCRGV